MIILIGDQRARLVNKDSELVTVSVTHKEYGNVPAEIIKQAKIIGVKIHYVLPIGRHTYLRAVQWAPGDVIASPKQFSLCPLINIPFIPLLIGTLSILGCNRNKISSANPNRKTT